MAYVVTIGRVRYKGAWHETGETVPALKGDREVEAMVEVGVVEWRDSRVKATAERKAAVARRKRGDGQ